MSKLRQRNENNKIVVAELRLKEVEKVIAFRFPYCVQKKGSRCFGRLPWSSDAYAMNALIAVCRASAYRSKVRGHDNEKSVLLSATSAAQFMGGDVDHALKFVERSAEIIWPKNGYATKRELARLLNLTSKEREELEVWRLGAVDKTEAQLKIDAERRARERSKKAKRAKRLAEGAKPQAESERRTKPWEEYGLSRATWYRRKKDGQPLPQKLSERPTVDYGDWMEEVPDVPS